MLTEREEIEKGIELARFLNGLTIREAHRVIDCCTGIINETHIVNAESKLFNDVCEESLFPSGSLSE